MDKNRPALLLYFAASMVYVMSVVFHWDTVITFLFKPMITPAIYFYYWQSTKGKVGIMPSLIIWLFYIGDMMILIEYEDILVPLITLNLAAYLIWGFYVTKDLLHIRNPHISGFTILIICLVILFLLSLLYGALTLVFSAADSNYGLLVVYGVTLVLLAVEAVTYYSLKNNSSSFYLLVGIFSLVICDLFYVLYNYYAPLEVFININVSCQAISFYFIVKFFITRNEDANLEAAYE
nr:hypothetical protein [uncultured Flavobacterium sp.]